MKELRVVLTARGMAEGGSWIVPRYLGEVRLRKPPAMYWAVAATMKASDGTESPLSARLPGVLAAVALCLVLAGGAARVCGGRAAFLGATVAVSSWLFLQHAGLAETDVALCLFTTLSVLAVYRGLRGPPSWRPWACAGLAAAAGFLVKGPAAIAIPAGTGLAFYFAGRRWRTRGTGMGWVWSAAVFLAVVSPWYVALLLRSDATGAAVRDVSATEMAATFLGKNHSGPLGYYLVDLPRQMMPWPLLLPPALWLLWRRARARPGPRFLLTWFTVSFVLLCVTGNKQEQYTVILLPSTSLIVGACLRAGFRARPSPMRTVCRALAATSLALLDAAGVWMAVGEIRDCAIFLSPAVAIGAILIVGSLALVSVARLRRFGLWVGGLAALAACLFVAKLVWLDPAAAYEASIVPFARAAGPLIAPEERVLVEGETHYRAVVEYYLHRRTVDQWGLAEEGDRAVAPRWRVVLTDGPTAGPVPPGAVLDLGSSRLRCLLYRDGASPPGRG
jgi:4-amino-4-deoxy-L-arabinose transferase-like glycosyltransferase